MPELIKNHADIESTHLEDLSLEALPVDLDDPHRAALENNPDHAERPSLATILAVLVSTVFHAFLLILTRA